jgi:hypothetical protein
MVALLVAAASAGAGETPSAVSPSAALDARYETLVREAQALCEAYRQAIAAKVDDLASKDLTLARLREAGMFTADAVAGRISVENPLLGLPYLKKAYEEIETHARELARELAHVAKERNEAAALGFMRKIVRAQQDYHDQDLDGNGISEYAESLGDLSLAGVKQAKNLIAIEGYLFRIKFANLFHWAAEGAPEKPGETGDRWFYVDDSGIVRAKKGGPADARSEPVQ